MKSLVRSGVGEVAESDRLAARLGVPMSEIAAFCDRWGVAELALFGSVLRDDFGPDSDVDVLVQFKAGRTPGLFVAARIRRELAEMCRRPVDLVHRPTIERSQNYIRRKRILGSARVVYAA
ncbi:MAG: nucleotidyltransferase domain-containing protein [Gemmatimonadetes bacterium]|nr:nucleotidyltransferase domain-containing protein [Gemmatimonadota bacterium]MCY3943230.1 nucleotidyltransferase domain-containing protein [Gemmatimonadota bacterium]